MHDVISYGLLLVLAFMLGIWTMAGAYAKKQKRILEWYERRRSALRRGETCKTCRFVIDYSDVEPPERCNAYCAHPFHSTWRSEHCDYAGHWTHTSGWCERYERATPQEGQ